MNILHYCDERHGWFRVKRSLLVDFNILDKISEYSYQMGDLVYLEEDADVWVLIRALNEREIDYKVTLKRTSKRSAIRNYQMFRSDCPPVKEAAAGMRVIVHGRQYTVVKPHEKKADYWHIQSPEGNVYCCHKRHMAEIINTLSGN